MVFFSLNKKLKKIKREKKKDGDIHSEAWFARKHIEIKREIEREVIMNIVVIMVIGVRIYIYMCVRVCVK